MIPAHSGQLAAIQFSPSGTRIATASDKGTVIRVFSVTGILLNIDFFSIQKLTITIFKINHF
jgi:autophagy-related protein 18